MKILKIILILSITLFANDEIWLGAKNFKVLTSYNNATTYGLAIHKIAEFVKD